MIKRLSGNYPVSLIAKWLMVSVGPSSLVEVGLLRAEVILSFFAGCWYIS